MNIAKKVLIKPLLIYLFGLVALAWALHRHPESVELIVLAIFVLSVLVLVISPFYLPVEVRFERQGVGPSAQADPLEQLQQLLSPEFTCHASSENSLDGFQTYGNPGIFRVGFEIRFTGDIARVSVVCSGPAIEDVYRIHKALDQISDALGRLGYVKSTSSGKKVPPT